MNTSDVTQRLRASRIGVALVVLTLFFGFAIGGAFGAFEESIKADLTARANAVADTVYGGDASKIKGVLDKSWSYYKRAHLHGGGIGAAGLGLLVLLALLKRPGVRVRQGLGLALGLGSLGYSVFWLLAARSAPTLGGTAAAKEALEWLAVPSAGLLLLGTVAVLVLTVVELFSSEKT